MGEIKTCVLRRKIREDIEVFAKETAEKISEIEKNNASILYAGFLEDINIRRTVAIILYRCESEEK